MNRTNKQNILKGGLLGFLLIFVAGTIAIKVTGYISRIDGGYYSSGNWNEYFTFLPILLIFSLVAGIFFSFLHSQAKKNEEWRINEARKRIAERERQEKEKESANDDEIQEQNIIRSHEEKEPK